MASPEKIKDENCRLDGTRVRVLTGKSVTLGLLMVVAVNLVAPYSEWVVRSTYMTTNYFPLGLAFSFIVVVVFLNPALKLVNHGFGLTGDELGIVLMMLLAAVSVPTYGITGYVISVSASPFYFSTTENGWAEYIHQDIPRWAVPGGGREVSWFFEGLPAGVGIPWNIWIVPLFWWCSLVVATLILCIALISIFRKQWVEKERLNFPLMDVPLLMMQGTADGRKLPTFMRSKLFWIGFALAAFKIAWNIPGYFNYQWPDFPPIRLSLARSPLFPGISTNFSFPLMAITYFVNVDVILSVWVFTLFNLAEVGLFNRTGFTIGASETYSINPSALAWQGFGAFAAIVLGGIWVAREHLRDVLRKAIRQDSNIDDSKEILSYRGAVLAFLSSALFILLWLRAAGIALHVGVLLLYAVITLYLGLTRIVIEGGLVFVRGPLVPQAFAMHVVGPATLGGSTMTGLALSYGWACDPIAIFMPFGANAARVHSELRFPRVVYLTTVGLALGVSLLVSFWFSLKLAYAAGGYNFGEWVFRRGGQVPFDTIVTKMKAAEFITPGRLQFLFVGILSTAILTYLRHRFTWWRLHPIGFSIASVGQVRWTVLSLFVAWMVKSGIIRLGGLALFERAKPLFVGMVVGHFMGAGFSFVIDAIWFEGQGHCLYF
jgi:hypothetical protein